MSFVPLDAKVGGGIYIVPILLNMQRRSREVTVLPRRRGVAASVRYVQFAIREQGASHIRIWSFSEQVGDD